MARRINLRGISKDRVYTVKSAARIVGVSEQTFRKWSKEGLRLMTDQRPYLVRGADLIDFLKLREASAKIPLRPGQFFCMRCKEPRFPIEGSVTYRANTAKTGRLSGTCGTCNGKLGQFCSAVKAGETLNLNAAPSVQTQTPKLTHQPSLKLALRQSPTTAVFRNVSDQGK